jgi:hypothetical protein
LSLCSCNLQPSPIELVMVTEEARTSMEDEERFEAMADACLKAHEAVAEMGTPAMLAMTRALLWQVGQELAQREERRKIMLRHARASEMMDMRGAQTARA